MAKTRKIFYNNSNFILTICRNSQHLPKRVIQRPDIVRPRASKPQEADTAVRQPHPCQRTPNPSLTQARTAHGASISRKQSLTHPIERKTLRGSRKAALWPDSVRPDKPQRTASTLPDMDRPSRTASDHNATHPTGRVTLGSLPALPASAYDCCSLYAPHPRIACVCVPYGTAFIGYESV